MKDRARRASESKQQKEERLRKRRERDRARRSEANNVADKEKVQYSVCILGSTCPLEMLAQVPSITGAQKRQQDDMSAISTALQLKRQKLASEQEDSRAFRLEQLRAYTAKRMEVEKNLPD